MSDTDPQKNERASAPVTTGPDVESTGAAEEVHDDKVLDDAADAAEKVLEEDEQ